MSRSDRPAQVSEKVRQVASMVSEWETSDELAGEFAERLLVFLGYDQVLEPSGECERQAG
jgi:hypothetical protein